MSLPAEEALRNDEAAKQAGMTRSEFYRAAARAYNRQNPNRLAARVEEINAMLRLVDQDELADIAYASNAVLEAVEW